MISYMVIPMSETLDIKRVEHSHIWAREEHEHYVEPEWCSRRLFAIEKFDGPILDPCCGFGNIPRSALAAGYEAYGADVVDRGYQGTLVQDFFNNPVKSGWTGSIVCNPPFDVFERFAKAALGSSASKVAMIWLVRTLPAARWLRQTPLAKIYLLTPRPSMPPGHVIAAGEKPGGGKQDFCWLVWDKAHVGPASIDWLHRDAR